MNARILSNNDLVCKYHNAMDCVLYLLFCQTLRDYQKSIKCIKTMSLKAEIIYKIKFEWSLSKLQKFYT